MYVVERTSCSNKNIILIRRLIGEICNRKKYRNQERKGKIFKGEGRITPLREKQKKGQEQEHDRVQEQGHE